MDWLCHRLPKKLPTTFKRKFKSSENDVKVEGFEEMFKDHHPFHELNKEHLIVPFVFAVTEMKLFYNEFARTSRRYSKMSKMETVGEDGGDGGDGEGIGKIKLVRMMNAISEINSDIATKEYTFYTTLTFQLTPSTAGLPFTMALSNPTHPMSHTELEDFVLNQACIRLRLNPSAWMVKGWHGNPKVVGSSRVGFRFFAMPLRDVDELSWQKWLSGTVECAECTVIFEYKGETKTMSTRLPTTTKFNQSLYETLRSPSTSGSFPLFHKCRITSGETKDLVSRRERPEKDRTYTIRIPVGLKVNDKPYVRYNVQFSFVDGTSHWFQIRVSPCKTALELFKKCLKHKKQKPFFTICAYHGEKVGPVAWDEHVMPYGSYSFIQVRTKDDWMAFLMDLRRI